MSAVWHLVYCCANCSLQMLLSVVLSFLCLMKKWLVICITERLTSASFSSEIVVSCSLITRSSLVNVSFCTDSKVHMHNIGNLTMYITRTGNTNGSAKKKWNWLGRTRTSISLHLTEKTRKKEKMPRVRTAPHTEGHVTDAENGITHVPRSMAWCCN